MALFAYLPTVAKPRVCNFRRLASAVSRYCFKGVYKECNLLSFLTLQFRQQVSWLDLVHLKCTIFFFFFLIIKAIKTPHIKNSKEKNQADLSLKSEIQTTIRALHICHRISWKDLFCGHQPVRPSVVPVVTAALPLTSTLGYNFLPRTP